MFDEAVPPAAGRIRPTAQEAQVFPAPETAARASLSVVGVPPLLFKEVFPYP